MMYQNLINDGDSWIVLNNLEKSIRSKIESKGTPLIDWDVSINYGIKTGYNDAFIINKESKEKIIANDPKSVKIIHPILRGRDIQKYVNNWDELYIIGTFPSLNLDIDMYPAVKEHLLSYGINRLMQSGEIGSRKKTRNKWFEIQDSISYWDDFSKQKIIWKRIGSVIRFSYDETGTYCLDSTCFLTGSNLKFLLGYLNSSISKKELLNNSPKTGTGDLIISVQALEPLLVPKASKNDMNRIEEIVDNCIQILSLNPTADISSLEKDIDEIIYKLFDLNENEKEFINNLQN